jgi:hypothetical protein
VIRAGNLLISNWTSAKRACVISTLPATAKGASEDKRTETAPGLRP